MSPVAELAEQPCPRQGPAAFEGRGRHVHRRRRFLDAEAAKEPQLDDARLLGIDRFEPRRAPHRAREAWRPRCGADDQRIDERHPVEPAPPLLRAARARPLDENLPHRPRGDPDEVAFVLPGRAGARQPEIGLVHERGRLKRLAGPLAAHVGARQPPQLVVDLRRQFVAPAAAPAGHGSMGRTQL